MFLSCFHLTFNSNLSANNNTRVDDVVNLFNYPNHTYKFPQIHPSLLGNREVDKFFQKETWTKYTLHNINEICVDAKDFIEHYIISKPRNVCLLFLPLILVLVIV